MCQTNARCGNVLSLLIMSLWGIKGDSAMSNLCVAIDISKIVNDDCSHGIHKHRDENCELYEVINEPDHNYLLLRVLMN